MTIIEKIFSRASGNEVRPGDYIWAALDLVVMRDFGGPNVVREYQSYFDNNKVFDSKKVVITFDLHIPARDERVARNQNLLRKFAREQNVRLFDVNNGIGQHIIIEQGLVRPGDVVVGTDSHMNLLGGIGVAGFGMGTTDIAGAMFKGRAWFRVPTTIKVIVNGGLQEFVGAKDVILFILKKLGTDGALNRAIEFYGETIERMNLEQRITIASMVTEMSGDIGFITPSAEILQFLGLNTNLDGIVADPEAQYEAVYEFSVTQLEPQIACPHSPDNVKNVREVAGIKVDQVFIGSCTNGRFEDLKAASLLLKGKKVKSGVRLIIVPATMAVAQKALTEGLYEIFLSAGAVVTNPGCALCTTGHPGILAPGEVMVSTSNRNFIGKLGKGAMVYLASPATAAATAIKGVICDPRDL
ncbi:hypothetical protein BXT86_00885 [candidate division WOR-3 bacterium 4484_100]|uniref:3-isopropylmalate dehydratase large subunit n=1 Tax=candidate division WOR-3 bacterium 4484_100 TaxID=1936077 RepID=A0A1V4QGL2_UNCW3|nr:MAG: hypothetical protein BXT86_00885 [candidate division WOR-3 bacterium 4484_100]